MRRSARSPLVNDNRHYGYTDLLKFQEVLCKEKPRRIYLDAGSWMLAISSDESENDFSILDLKELGIAKIRAQPVYTIYGANACCEKCFENGTTCEGIDYNDDALDMTEYPYYTTRKSIAFGETVLKGKQMSQFYIPNCFDDRVMNGNHMLELDSDQVNESALPIFEHGCNGLLLIGPTTFGLGGQYESVLSYGASLDDFNVGVFVIEPKDWPKVRAAIEEKFKKYDEVVKKSMLPK